MRVPSTPLPRHDPARERVEAPPPEERLELRINGASVAWWDTSELAWAVNAAFGAVDDAAPGATVELLHVSAAQPEVVLFSRVA